MDYQKTNYGLQY